MMKYIKNAREIGFTYFILKRGLDNIAYNGPALAQWEVGFVRLPGCGCF